MNIYIETLPFYLRLIINTGKDAVKEDVRRRLAWKKRVLKIHQDKLLNTGWVL